MEKLFRRLIRLEIVLIYLVILAGSVVRMTGSGMGCPDWPKCFGYLIPPTQHEQVEWQPMTFYPKGRIIVYQEGLLVAKEDFTTESAFVSDHWEPYTRHDYAIFNPFHTWTEYINRLLGALSGIPMLAIVGLALWRWKKDKISLALAALGLLLLGFEAWLGKLVVDGNLIPGQISLHMFGALSIVATLMLLLQRNSVATFTAERAPQLAWLLPVSLVLLLIQIYLGTSVREEVDILEREGLMAREAFVGAIGEPFIIHRSFSWLLLLASGIFFWKNRKLAVGKAHLAFTLSALLAGIVLAYLGLPRAFQPIHLLIAAGFFGWLFYQSIRKRFPSQP